MKFNFNTKRSNAILNYENAEAFRLTPAMELYTAVATAGLNDQFYEKANDKVQRIGDLIEKNDAVFVAKLAIYAREAMNLRSIPLVLTVELAERYNGNALISQLTTRVIQRADEITELLAYYALANDRKNVKQLNKLSKQMQKGLAAAFNRFDEYQFAKYNRDVNVKLRDALFLVHPKAKDEAQQILFNKIVNDELQVPYTWEVELSVLGQQKFDSAEVKKDAFRAKWEELIFSNKVGYMATLRNLRNILEAEVSKAALNKVCDYLSNENAVAKSKQLPFRFLSAYRELRQLNNGRTATVLNALEKAVLFSAQNIAGYNDETKVVIASDVSGSMATAISGKSAIQNFDIGLMLSMLLQSRCENVITGIFGDTWKAINVPGTNILANVDTLRSYANQVGFSTNGYLVIKDLLHRRKVVDKIMMFTDCQMWNSNNTTETISGLWKQYKQIAPNAKLYLFDLAGYGNTPLNVLRDDVFLVAGWSDKIFDVLNAIENGSNAIQMINDVQL